MQLPTLRPSFLALFTVTIVAGSCTTLGDGSPERFEPLGAYQREASTDDDEARFWFDQGLLWTYGFNHDEAVRSFREAQRLDPDFALAYWGEAYALGPNINAPLGDRAAALRAFEACRQAQQHAGTATPIERALIEAMATRYADASDLDVEDPDQRKSLDHAFAEAMQQVYERFPGDPDVATIYADARMNETPWNYWTEDGEPVGAMGEALAALRRVVREHPAHPGGHHLLIHVTEDSPNPNEGVPSAEALAALVPGSGHLVHMPAHTFHRVGRYYDAEIANRDAVAIDRAYFARVGPQGIYEGYRAHNHHFQAWSAMFGGRFEAARNAAQNLVADLPAPFHENPGPFDGFFPTELHVLIRFGRWDDILATPTFADGFPVSLAMQHYARGIALAAKGDPESARAEQKQLLRALEQLPEGASVGINPAGPIFEVAKAMLEGEIRYREGRFDEAFAMLQTAIANEDALRYDEPRGWMTPVRHALGALALEQGRLDLAEQAYREDLVRNPENGWALHGLAECLDRQGETEEAAEIRVRFAKAWQHADTDLTNGSCFCRGAVAAESAGAACCEVASGG